MRFCTIFFILFNMIGLICNEGLSEEGNEIYYVYKNFLKLDIDYMIIPLTNYDDIVTKIKMCRGIIMQGGDDYLPIHLDIIKYLYDHDIPLLAICMSMQAMGVLFNGNLKLIDNHKRTCHQIFIKSNTLLYEILKIDNLIVNSFHKYSLTTTNLDVSGYSDCIEAIEDKSKRFFLGLQWHPEKMIEYDKLERKIFDYFKEVCYGIKRVN